MLQFIVITPLKIYLTKIYLKMGINYNEGKNILQIHKVALYEMLF